MTALTYRAPLAVEPLFRFLGERAIPGVETFDRKALTLRRSLRTADGGTATMGVAADPAGGITLDAPDDPALRPTITAIARRWLDLDADATTIGSALAEDPALRPVVTAQPGIRVPGTVDGFELAVRAILGQQITVRGARTLAGRVVDVAGTGIADGPAGITHVFPTAAELAEAPLEGLGLTGTRIATLRRLSALVADGTLDLTPEADRGATAETLRAIPGIGPWTTAYVAMRALREPDAFPASDLGVHRGFETLGLPATPRAIVARAERWRPWRAYAAMYLWTAAD